MRVNPIIATAVVGMLFGALGWLCISMIEVKIDIAQIKEHMHIGDRDSVGYVQPNTYGN